MGPPTYVLWRQANLRPWLRHPTWSFRAVQDDWSDEPLNERQSRCQGVYLTMGLRAGIQTGFALVALLVVGLGVGAQVVLERNTELLKEGPEPILHQALASGLDAYRQLMVGQGDPLTWTCVARPVGRNPSRLSFHVAMAGPGGMTGDDARHVPPFDWPRADAPIPRGVLVTVTTPPGKWREEEGGMWMWLVVSGTTPRASTRDLWWSAHIKKEGIPYTQFLSDDFLNRLQTRVDHTSELTFAVGNGEDKWACDSIPAGVIWDLIESEPGRR